MTETLSFGYWVRRRRKALDLTRPEQVYQLLVPDLPSEFPALRSLERWRTNRA